MEGQHPEWKPDQQTVDPVVPPSERTCKGFREIRESLGMSVAQFAHALRVKAVTVRFYESGTTPSHRIWNAALLLTR
jgi:DNA-binding transcriptional regulator YiaG